MRGKGVSINCSFFPKSPNWRKWNLDIWEMVTVWSVVLDRRILSSFSLFSQVNHAFICSAVFQFQRIALMLNAIFFYSQTGKLWVFRMFLSVLHIYLYVCKFSSFLHFWKYLGIVSILMRKWARTYVEKNNNNLVSRPYQYWTDGFWICEHDK